MPSKSGGQSGGTPIIRGSSQRTRHYPELGILTNIYHIANSRNLMIGGDGDIAARNQTPSLEQADFHTALDVDLGDYYRHLGDEFELQLRPAAVWFARRVRRIQSFEHDAFAILPA